MKSYPKHIHLLFLLIRKGLCSQNVGSIEISRQIYPQVYSAAVNQGMTAIVWDALREIVEDKTLPADCRPDKGLAIKWALNAEKVEHTYDWQYKTASELADLYGRNGMHTVVLKGISASTWYPVPNHRPCGDLDCFLMGEYEKGNRVAREAGADVDLVHYKHSHINYKGLPIDNHQYLTHIRGSKEAREFERILRDIVFSEERSPINNTCLEEPSPLFHALFLTRHAHHHFLAEDIRIRHLADWAMFMNKYGDDVDWKYFSDVCEKHGMKQFADTMTRLSRDVIGIVPPSSYILSEDSVRDEFMLDTFFGEGDSVYNSHKTFSQRRMLIVKNHWRHRRKYKLFSNKSAAVALIQSVFGYFLKRESCYDTDKSDC